MKKRERGFTLIELMVVIAIIGILSTIALGALSKARLRARDSKRITEIRQLETGLELYYTTYGQYPDSDNGGCGSWDTPGDGTFLAPLAANNFIQNLSDPTTNDSCGNYRYYRYPPGSYGCPTNRGYYYVIEVIGFDSFSGASPSNPGFTCTGRDWTGEGAWVTGKYEN